MALSGGSQGGEFTSAFGGAAEVYGRMASAAFDANDPKPTLRRLPWRDERAMDNHVLYFRRHRIDDVGFDGPGSIVAQRFKIHVADTRDGLVVHLLKRPAVP